MDATMKRFALAFALTTALAGSGCETPAAVDAPPPEAPQTPAVAATAHPGEPLLKIAHRCAGELFPEGKGVAGQRLRYDAMALSPHRHRFASAGPTYEIPEPTSTTWHVRIEEEHPHRQTPNGAEYVIDVARGTCVRAPMD